MTIFIISFERPPKHIGYFINSEFLALNLVTSLPLLNK